ncbi:MAG: metallophosphatase family protein [Chloroflexota bacterium]|nr:metallophosphatase family protein [Chloroflexota bacterium]
MRIGLIADIHGNCIALDAVLAELERERVNELICLGDVAALGPQPGEVIARLRALGCPVVMGNTDVWLLAPPSDTIADAIDRATTRWCVAQLTEGDLAYVSAFPAVIEHSLGAGRTLLCFHGSPRSFDDTIIATTPNDDLDVMLNGYDATIMAGGHTHIQMLRCYRDCQIINPGSTGLPGVGSLRPYNRNVHWAEYAVLDVDDDVTRVSFHRIALDVEKMIAAAYASGMPEPDWWASLWKRG